MRRWWGLSPCWRSLGGTCGFSWAHPLCVSSPPLRTNPCWSLYNTFHMIFTVSWFVQSLLYIGGTPGKKLTETTGKMLSGSTVRWGRKGSKPAHTRQVLTSSSRTLDHKTGHSPSSLILGPRVLKHKKEFLPKWGLVSHIGSRNKSIAFPRPGFNICNILKNCSYLGLRLAGFCLTLLRVVFTLPAARSPILMETRSTSYCFIQIIWAILLCTGMCTLVKYG